MIPLVQSLPVLLSILPHSNTIYLLPQQLTSASHNVPLNILESTTEFNKWIKCSCHAPPLVESEFCQKHGKPPKYAIDLYKTERFCVFIELLRSDRICLSVIFFRCCNLGRSVHWILETNAFSEVSLACKVPSRFIFKMALGSRGRAGRRRGPAPWGWLWVEFSSVQFRAPLVCVASPIFLLMFSSAD